MISAFGVVHKAERYVPTPEQLAAQQARRDGQAAGKAGRQEIRVGAGKASSWASHVHRGPAINVALSGATAAGAAYVLHRRRKARKLESVAKADDGRKGDAALGAVAGAAGADAALTVAGQGLKGHLKRQREKLGVSPREEKVWAEHKAKFGVHGATDSTLPNKTKIALHSSYPKQLPGWKAQRALAFKNRPTVVGASVAGAALAGAALAHHRSGVKKADDGKRHAEEAGAGAVGAGAGQGAYQGAGYGTKHFVDSRTRKGGVGVTPAQVNRQDKILKPLKRAHGMHLPKGSPGRDNVGYHRAYPTKLPHGTTIRVLGHTHEGRLGVAVGTGATVLGGASAFGVAHHLTKPKERS